MLEWMEEGDQMSLQQLERMEEGIDYQYCSQYTSFGLQSTPS